MLDCGGLLCENKGQRYTNGDEKSLINVNDNEKLLKTEWRYTPPLSTHSDRPSTEIRVVYPAGSHFSVLAVVPPTVKPQYAK